LGSNALTDYLDFETMMTAIPCFEETPPYAQIPTQYSIHHCSSIGKVSRHVDYLADINKDCRQELTEKLILDLAGSGSILVYSSFEKTILKGLSRRFPQFEKDLAAIIDRLVDLEAIIKEGVYHPHFFGSSSIKKTLSALVPSLDYEDLRIRDGSTAMAAFALMFKKIIPATEVEATRSCLREYCKRDTLAMVRLHEALANLVETESGRTSIPRGN
jgi:hypothetical protein